jgi:hypothetical protein
VLYALDREMLALGDELTQELGLGCLAERRKPDTAASGDGD